MIEQLSLFIIHLIQSTGYIGIFILMTLESALIPIPSEVTMPFAGYLANKGTLSLPLIVFVGALGNLVGSLIGYYIGYFLEESVLLTLIKNYGKFVLFTEEDYTKSAHWFKKYGQGIVFFTRLLPAIRTFISLPAGVFQMNIWKFSIYTFLGSLLWSAFLTYIGYYLGSKWASLEPLFNKFHIVIVVVVLGLVGFYVYHKLHKMKKRAKVK